MGLMADGSQRAIEKIGVEIFYPIGKECAGARE
jgi:hypothetical protein